MRKFLFIVFIASLFGQTCWGRDFVNLGFEDADVSGQPFNGDSHATGVGDITDLLPGWTVFFGTNQWHTVWLNQLYGDSFIGIADNPKANSQVLSGFFALIVVRTTNDPVWTIEQTGVIPAGAQYLVFRTSDGVMDVEINGKRVPELSGVTTYAGATNAVYDISEFSGQEVQLDLIGPFQVPNFSTMPPQPGADAWIDDIRFVNQPALGIALAGQQIRITWPASENGWVLQTTSALAAAATWTDVSIAPVVSGAQKVVTLSPTNSYSFYRLRLQ